MPAKTVVIIVSAGISVALAALVAQPLLKQAWHGYLNQHASHYYVRQMATFNARKDLNLSRGAVLFYGDSLVQGLNVSSAAGPAVNYGIGHATAITIAEQIQQHKNLSRADVIVIAVGINDITRGQPDHILPAYRDALNKIPDTVTVIINQIMPVSEAELNRPGLTNLIVRVNAQLEKLCSATPGTLCLDASTALAGHDGQLKREYHTGDGLHLSAAGNTIWLNLLRTALQQAVGLSKTRGGDADG